MNIQDLNGKSVCMLGYGREGKAMVAALEKYAPNATITIADQNTGKIQDTRYKIQTGTDWLSNLDRFDTVIKSPGIPPQKELEALGDKLTNSTQIFLDSIPSETVVIGITGSKGKSTVASLIFAILKKAGKNTMLVGNIGDAAIAHIGNVTAHTIVVAEISSYQLMQLTRSPHIAVLTSFFPEHLDYHSDIDAYREVKKNIYRFQKSDDFTIYNGESEAVQKMVENSPSKKMPYTTPDAAVTLEETHLIGAHNLLNIAAATKVASALHIDPTDVIKALQTFRVLPHRLQSLGVHRNIEWIDDAISTTPDSTIAAISCFGSRLQCIILGGKDRNLDLNQLGKTINNSSIAHVIIMGENSDRMAQIITNSSIQIHKVHTMAEAVDTAKNALKNSTTTHPVVLLSPAAASYDMYSNFEQKGSDFASEIEK